MVYSETVSGFKHPFDVYRSERRLTTAIAFTSAILLHLGLLLVLPQQILRPAAPSDADEAPLEVTLVPPEPLTAEQLRFVEANPDAPENEPDKKDQYSFRSQQAASEAPSDSLLPAPNVDGETDSQKIIQGALEQIAPLPPGVYTPMAQPGEGEGTDGGKQGAQAQPMLAPAQPLPAPEFIQQKPIDTEGPGSSPEIPGLAQEILQKPDPNAPINVYRTQVQQSIEPAQAGDGNGGSVEAKPMPRERPRLAPELVRGPLMRSTGSVSRRGALAIDATFSEFGEYQQQFYAALQAGWYQEIEFFQPIDTATSATVSFTIESNGRVRDVRVVHTTASEIATIICESAITKRSPFRPWTKEMVQVFGSERTLTVTFHYR